jgi:hypothetical protein
MSKYRGTHTMKTIALIAVAAVILIQWSGAVPNSSVGGPMTLAVVFLAAALAVGVHEAWTMKRGVLGWIVSIVTAFAGFLVAGLLGGTIMDLVMGAAAKYLNLEGSLAATRHPLLYITSAAMMLFILFGAWLALRAVSRWR